MFSLLGFLIRDLLRNLYLSLVHFLIGHLLTELFMWKKSQIHDYSMLKENFCVPKLYQQELRNHQEEHRWPWRIVHKILSETQIMMSRGSNEASHYIISWGFIITTEWQCFLFWMDELHSFCFCYTIWDRKRWIMCLLIFKSSITYRFAEESTHIQRT